MNLLEYKAQIAYAATAAELHEIRKCSQCDPQLCATEKRAVGDAICSKFSKMNRVAAGSQSPRWK